MSNKEISEYIFKGVVTVLMTLALFILGTFSESLNKMQESVNELNVSFATMAERLVNQSNVSKRLERRIEKLEGKHD